MKLKIIAALLLVVASRARCQSPPQQLEFAERDFQRATIERGVEGWNAFFADSGAQLQNTSRIVRGHTAIKALMGEFLASTSERLIWWPVATELSRSGDMAYTFGASGVVSADSTGKLVIEGRGTYLTVWRKQVDKSWKVTADMGGQASARALERASDTVAAKAVENLERQRSEAVENKDPSLLDRLYSRDFLSITLSGAVRDRKDEILYATRAAKSELSRIESLSVTVAGETGIATGIRRAAADNSTVTRSSFLNVYVRRHGEWEFVRGLSNPMK